MRHELYPPLVGSSLTYGFPQYRLIAFLAYVISPDPSFPVRCSYAHRQYIWAGCLRVSLYSSKSVFGNICHDIIEDQGV